MSDAENSFQLDAQPDEGGVATSLTRRRLEVTPARNPRQPVAGKPVIAILWETPADALVDRLTGVPHVVAVLEELTAEGFVITVLVSDDSREVRGVVRDAELSISAEIPRARWIVQTRSCDSSPELIDQLSRAPETRFLRQ